LSFAHDLGTESPLDIAPVGVRFRVIAGLRRTVAICTAERREETHHTYRAQHQHFFHIDLLSHLLLIANFVYQALYAIYAIISTDCNEKCHIIPASRDLGRFLFTGAHLKA